jgi:hypothetical protein
MTEITNEEGKALVLVLSLVENHPMWTENRGNPQSFKDEVYAAITTVRQFLKKNNIMTAHEFLERAVRRQEQRAQAIGEDEE